MIKTILAGTVLSTGLFAGGVLGAEDVKKDEKVEKATYTQTMNSSTEEGAPAEGTVKSAVGEASKDGKAKFKELDESEVSKGATSKQSDQLTTVKIQSADK